jgi:glycosyltransferase involved in cell wall biosynthesis
MEDNPDSRRRPRVAAQIPSFGVPPTMPESRLPSFSVVIVNFNYRNFVAEAVDSALEQDLAPNEVIVVDDGSTDGSPDLLRERYGQHPRVRLLCKENGGQLSGFIAALPLCTGDILCLLDSDDLWEKHHLRTLAQAYQQDPSLDCVFTNLAYFGARSGTYDVRNEDYDYGLTALPTAFLRRWTGAPTSALSIRLPLARRVLDLPPPHWRDWWTDDCIVYGSSLYGAHKKYLAAATARYRIHGHNDSLFRRREGVPQMKHEYKVQRLIDHYCRDAGFGNASLRLVKHEFKTKPRPSREDLKLYRELLRQAPFGFWQRLELRLSMWRHYRRTRRVGP